MSEAPNNGSGPVTIKQFWIATGFLAAVLGGGTFAGNKFIGGNGINALEIQRMIDDSIAQHNKANIHPGAARRDELRDAVDSLEKLMETKFQVVFDRLVRIEEKLDK